MFIAVVQLIDIFALGIVQMFLLFFIASWVSYLYRINKSAKYDGISHEKNPRSVSVIVPVVDEPMDVWVQVMAKLKSELIGIDSEVVVVCNGGNGVANGKLAEDLGFTVIYEKQAGKRNAIAVAARRAGKELVVILDSDTIVGEGSIRTIASAFIAPLVGGVTPRHEITDENANFWRKISAWMEDIRFHNSLRGLSTGGVVNCLPGRLFAMRRNLLDRYLDRFTNQYVLGRKMETGDDRVLTQWMLEDGYDTLYDDSATVYTSAPDTLAQFAKQRTRWARSSFREGMLSLRSIFEKRRAVSWYSVIDIFFRWWFAVIIAMFVWKLLTGTATEHFTDFTFWQYLVFGLIGFIANGFLRQLPHLTRYPKDILITPLFLLANLIILTPVEWYGNATFLKQGWMTRRTE